MPARSCGGRMLVACLISVLAGMACLLSSATAADSARQWSSTDGRTMTGTLEEAGEDSVKIRREDGRTFSIPLEKLSAPDRAFVASVNANARRMKGLEEGPYAEAIRGEWVKFSADKHGLIFQLYGGKELKRKKDTLFPLFIYLHGAGSKAEDVEAGKVETAARTMVSEEQYAKTPCFVCAPLCAPDLSWGPQVDKLHALIDDLIGNLPIDRDRIYLSGYSMGARGIASLLQARPDFYAAAMFADGAADPEWAKTINAALWLCFSGERDIESARKTAEAFQAAGKTAHFEGYPEATHNQIGFKLAKNPEVYEWIFGQKRLKAGAPATP